MLRLLKTGSESGFADEFDLVRVQRSNVFSFAFIFGVSWTCTSYNAFCGRNKLTINFDRLHSIKCWSILDKSRWKLLFSIGNEHASTVILRAIFSLFLKDCFFLVFVIYSFLYFPFIEIKLRRNSLQWHTLNKLPRRTALHCITEHKALARRPSIQPNITLWCLAWSVRQLLSARCPQCRNLINTNRNNKRTHTLT